MSADSASVLAWREELSALEVRLGELFVRAEPRRQAGLYLEGLLSAAKRKNGWQLAEQIGDARPWRTQRVLIRTPADGVGRGFSGIGNTDRLKGQESRRRTMAHVADHLSVLALEQQYRSCTDVTAARHCQTIWLLAKGHDLAQVSATVSYARRWVEIPWVRLVAPGSLAECGC